MQSLREVYGHFYKTATYRLLSNKAIYLNYFFFAFSEATNSPELWAVFGQCKSIHLLQWANSPYVLVGPCALHILVTWWRWNRNALCHDANCGELHWTNESELRGLCSSSATLNKLNFTRWCVRSLARRIHAGQCNSFKVRSLACEKRLLASSCLSVRPRGKTWLPLDGFSWNLIFQCFSKICWENSSFNKIWQE
jgi:hypothetical protein